MCPAEYDSWYDSSLGAACFAAELTLLRRGAGNLTGKTLLDVGCGTGRFLLALGQEAAHATGVDRNIAMLVFGRDRTSSEVTERCAWIAGDVSDLPLATASLDVVFENTVLCCCADPLARHLRDGSRLPARRQSPPSGL